MENESETEIKDDGEIDGGQIETDIADEGETVKEDEEDLATNSEENTFTVGSPTKSNSFYTIPTENFPPERHENCAVFCNSKYYLIGGRRLPGIWSFDPSTNLWSEGTNPWKEIHHMPCFCVQDKFI